MEDRLNCKQVTEFTNSKGIVTVRNTLEVMDLSKLDASVLQASLLTGPQGAIQAQIEKLSK